MDLEAIRSAAAELEQGLERDEHDAELRALMVAVYQRYTEHAEDRHALVELFAGLPRVSRAAGVLVEELTWLLRGAERVHKVALLRRLLVVVILAGRAAFGDELGAALARAWKVAERAGLDSGEQFRWAGERAVGPLARYLYDFEPGASARDEAAVEVPDALERRLLELVQAGGGNASWHWLATRLPAPGVPLQPDMMVALRALRARGLVEHEPTGGGMDRWEITAAGTARLDELTPTIGPLTGAQLEPLLAALRGPAQERIAALIPFLDDGALMSGVLRQVLAADAELAPQVAFGASLLPQELRPAFARELLADARASVREAVFRAWCPARMDVPGQALRVLPDADWDELLRRGLTDPEPAVRGAAAALAFASDAGGALVDELVAVLEVEPREPRFWAALALGAARDARSRDVLVGLVDGHDLLCAAAAVRALAARPDGRARWLAAIDDLRADVHQAAVFALAEVATDLSDEEVAALERDGRAPVQGALRAYHARRAS